MTSPAALQRSLRETIALLQSIMPTLDERLAAMTDAMNGWPRSHAFDQGPGREQITFCEVHQIEKCGCGRGTTYARNSDTVGEAAIRPDAAARDRKRVDELVRDILARAEEMWRILECYRPHPPTEKDRRESLTANDRDTSCSSCSRVMASTGVPVWEPASRTVEMGGKRRPLCWWCFDWVRKGEGKLPTVGELTRHHQGQRVRRGA